MKTKTILSFLIALVFNFTMGAMAAQVAGFDPAIGGLSFIAAGAALSHIPMPSGVAFAGLLKEIWISKLMERFYSNAGFLLRSVNMSQFVENNTINLADCGVDPDVLINNVTYPVPTAERTDAALALPLDYFDTKNTVVRNAEAVQLAYNKLESVVSQHRNALAEKTSSKACHTWAPSADGANTPVIAATGADRGDGTKKLTLKDIATAQLKLDKLKVPATGRILVLSPEHRSDILMADTELFKAFTNLKVGEILPLFGFDVYWTQLTPVYHNATGVKAAFGAAPAGTDAVSSIFYHEAEVMRADGTTDMFSKIKDPSERGDVVGFQKRFLAMPIRAKFNGAIYSAAV